MDQQETVNHEVIEELRQVRIAANELYFYTYYI